MFLPYLTAAFPGIGGSIKARPEDFFVQEMPLYEPTGQGEHVYCDVQKINMTTFEAVGQIAKALNVQEREIGFAGMKDARAVTRQIFSIRGTTEAAVMAMRIKDLTVQWAVRHGNKLRLGHLSGNRFAIKIRDVSPTDVVKIKLILEMLERRGLPNYFGEQRFGRRDNNAQLGAALVRGDNMGLLKILLGSPDTKVDDTATLEARRKFETHENDAAMKAWPRRCGMERRILARLMKTHRPAAAVRAIDYKLRRLWVSALQSRMFNEVVMQRADSIDKLLDGDLAYKHDNGACFRVDAATVEQARCESFEISPTGPLVGYRMTLPQGDPLRIEEQVFAAAGLTLRDFRQDGKEGVKGARRPLRVKPNDMVVEGGGDEHGPYVAVAFTLPAGSFATILLREIMKNDAKAVPATVGASAEEDAADFDDDDAADQDGE